MTRVKRGSVARRHRKNILEFAAGFRGAHSRLFRAANQQEQKALASAYADRSNRKREMRRLWIARINAAARENGITYGGIIHNLSENRVYSNCKTLAQIATPDAYCFSRIVQAVTKRGTLIGFYKPLRMISLGEAKDILEWFIPNQKKRV
uniref:Large ribosomal subunit protein bL20c n=2 Tax=Azolla TaxID=39630 RepID=A0A291R6T0_9MONI|nr:ribosomal protein L20 [Azolla mexicana]ATL58227.1 ribosomal protein L20 [Azolla microphylla]